VNIEQEVRNVAMSKNNNIFFIRISVFSANIEIKNKKSILFILLLFYNLNNHKENFLYSNHSENYNLSNLLYILLFENVGFE